MSSKPESNDGESIYSDGTYLEANSDWHAEDSPWKAGKIACALNTYGHLWESAFEIGCGVGGVLTNLASHFPDKLRFHGYDISRMAIDRADPGDDERIEFTVGGFEEIRDGVLEILCQSFNLYGKRIETWQRSLILKRP